jgi:CubicO group peptidase (beta-lactamase class C family)
VLAFIDAVEADADIELHSLMLLRRGHVVAEGWWSPHTPDRTRLVYSISKSFTSTALAFAVQEGLLSLEDTVVSHLPELDGEITDPRTRRTRIRHLASMASGHDRDVVEEAMTADPQDLVRGFLRISPDAEPGTLFAYNQPCTYTIAAIIQQKTGMLLTEYLRPRLFDPLGIGVVGWQARPADRQLGFSGLFARTEDVAKLGQLYLQRGRWEDTQLIPRAYADEATSRQIDNPAMENPDWRQGYGFWFWMARHGYRGDGAFGQFCIVLPEQDAVLAMTGGTEAMQAVLENVWTHLLPGLGVDSPNADALPEMTARLASLALPASVGGSDAPGGWSGELFEVSGDRTPFSSLTMRSASDRLVAEASGAGGRITFPVGVGSWRVSEPRDQDGAAVPVAASGGWLGDDTLRLEVIYLETPHRIDVVCSIPDRTAAATWRTVPLFHGGAANLHRPV